MHRLFISDLHLSDDTPEIEAALVSLLQREAGFDSLVILGDFFEAWVGDDDNAPLADRIKTLLQALTDGGVDLMITKIINKDKIALKLFVFMCLLIRSRFLIPLNSILIK